MIGQIKILDNADKIKEYQELVNKTVQENNLIEKENAQLAKAKRLPLKELPKEVKPEYKNSDLLLKSENIDLAFVNGDGQISIKYQGDNFNLVHSDSLWKKIKALPQFN